MSYQTVAYGMMHTHTQWLYHFSTVRDDTVTSETGNLRVPFGHYLSMTITAALRVGSLWILHNNLISVNTAIHGLRAPLLAKNNIKNQNLANRKRGAIKSPIDWNIQIEIWIDVIKVTFIWTDSVLGVRNCEKLNKLKNTDSCPSSISRVRQGFWKEQ